MDFSFAIFGTFPFAILRTFPFAFDTTNLTPAQTAILVSLMVSLPALLLVPGAVGVPFLIFGLTLHCALTQGCMSQIKEMNTLADTFGSSGINTVEWTIKTLNKAFAKYPLLPEASPAMQFMAGMGLGLLGLDTVTDFATLISGRDPITGHALTPQEMFVTWLAFSIPLVSAGFLRGFADDAVEMADDLPLLGGEACSFSADTPVATAAGQTAISDVAVGDQVLAWNEELGQSGYYTVTAVWAHADPVTVHLVINGEAIETTPEHPFLTTNGEWVAAGALQVGEAVRNANGDNGVVQAVEFVATPQVMYNMTVADAHTYTVGDDEWVVHNACIPALRNFGRKDFYAGGEKFSLTRERLVHVLERHHPQYWDGSVKTVQTFLDEDLSIDDVTDLVKSTIQKGFDTRVAASRRSTFTYQAIIDGVTYQARTEYGKVVQFFSLP